MHFLIEDEELLKKYDIWNKVSNSNLSNLITEPIYNKKFLKTKMKSYSDETRNFHNKEVPKIGSNYTCLAVIFIDFVLIKD